MQLLVKNLVNYWELARTQSSIKEKNNKRLQNLKLNFTKQFFNKYTFNKLFFSNAVNPILAFDSENVFCILKSINQ